MDITLETVRRALLPVFGVKSMITNYIATVEKDASIPTACIDSTKRLRYNPDFVKKWINSPEDLFCLIAHEMLHSALYHILCKPDEVMNVAADAIINSMITLGFPNESGRGSLFRSFYNKPQGLEQLLRADSPAEHRGRFRYLYRALWAKEQTLDPYPTRVRGGFMYSRPSSTADVTATLRLLWGTSKFPKRGLLGSHPSNNETVTKLPKDLTGALADAISQALDLDKSGPKGAGVGDSLRKIFKEILETARSLDQKLMERFSDQQKVSHFLELERASFSTMTPFPISISKRDLILLAADAHTGYFRVNPLRQEEREKFRKKATVFLDVSGSVLNDLPEILGILRNIKKHISRIFVFSNQCVEAQWRDLEAGQLDTTGGTDFDCVADKILQLRAEKSIVFTDGVASMDNFREESLTTESVEILTVLFSGATEEPVFKKWGPVVQLENITV